MRAVAASLLIILGCADMREARVGHTATLLDDGSVLIAGGRNNEDRCRVPDPHPHGGCLERSNVSPYLTLVERYDAGSLDLAASMAVPRAEHSATLLEDGTVLVAGGYHDQTLLAGAERYDPALDAWREAAPLSGVRREHQAVRLADGSVLVAGGWRDQPPHELVSAEIYLPAADSWRAAAPMPGARSSFTMTALRDGRVLVAGGNDENATGHMQPSAFVYDPLADHWLEAAPMRHPRSFHSATLLEDGRVLVAGGEGLIHPPDTTIGSLTSTELFDPQTMAWSLGPALPEGRTGHQAVALPGVVVVIGGDTMYQWDLGHDVLALRGAVWERYGRIDTRRTFFTATPLANGSVLVAGGYAQDGGSLEALADIELFEP